MVASRILATALLVVGATQALAADMVAVPGASAQFAVTTEASIDGKPVKLVLTGAALRQKLFFNVYAVAGYVQEGTRVRSPEELAAVDCPKRLELVMERTVEGKEMAEAFRAAIRQNYPAPAFDHEVADLVQFIQGQTAQQGDHIVITHVPGVGVHCDLAGKAGVLIKNPQFSRAVWDIYLGKNNLGDDIKKGLASRL
jgi:Chalcone isomerase-like